MMTGPLCKAARALVQVSRAKLATRADAPKDHLESFERGLHTPDPDALAKLQATLAVFIAEEGANGVGVRLISQSVTDRLRILVDEGGPSSPDAVP